MSFLWPFMLVLLLAVPVLIAVYIFAQRRRQRYALRYASLSLVREALGRGPGIRRHIPPALFLLSLTAMLIGLARPVAVIRAPAQEGTVILAIDVSGSMSADDLQPSRMEAAKAAARAFVELKAPTKPGDPARYRDAHDKRQFVRFQYLPVWAISNFSSLRVFQRDDPIASIEIVPEAALEPETTDAKAERLIRKGDPAGLIKALTPLALADPPPANDAKQLAGNMAHAARLVRGMSKTGSPN